MNYYNEFDKHTAEWLRQLIAIGAIPKGEVDERSITEVTADDLTGFKQCHFFAGIGGWPEALRRAGWSADRPVWTGSCPCQSFSCAGKGQGVEDQRDLWPHFFRLIRECRPERVFGEQVAAAIGHGWLDRLSADLEAEGYAVGSAVLGAHSAGADNIRQRLYWVADAESIGRKQQPRQKPAGIQQEATKSGECVLTTCGRSAGEYIGLADAELRRPEQRDAGQRAVSELDADGGVGRVGDTSSNGGATGVSEQGPRKEGDAKELNDSRHGECFWSNAVAIPCRDGKARRFEPGIFPLAHGIPRGVGYSGDPRAPDYVNATQEGRVMRLKGYGNAINVETARMFVEACNEG